MLLYSDIVLNAMV